MREETDTHNSLKTRGMLHTGPHEEEGTRGKHGSNLHCGFHREERARLDLR